MKTIDALKIGVEAQQFLNSKGNAPWIITSKGKTIAALVHLDEEELEDFLMCNDPDFIAMLQRSRKSFKKSDCISSADLRKKYKVREKVKGGR